MKLYYYVPPCPACGSRRTGRIMRQPFLDAGYIKEQALKNGELLRFAKEEPINNAFCEECGRTWPTKIEGKLWRDARVQEEAIARGTQEQYLAIQEEKAAAELASATQKKGFLAGLIPFSFGPSVKVKSAEPPEQPKRDEPKIVDKRPSKDIEILYADEELMQVVLNNET